MFKKYYTANINFDVQGGTAKKGSIVQSVYFWESALDAHKKAAEGVREGVGSHAHIIDFRRVK